MGEERREVGGSVYRLRRIPRSVSLFLSFLTNREKTIHLYIACLSLSLPPFSAKTLLYIRTLPRGSTQAETRNRFLRCANRRWLKIKAPRILSSSLLYSPFVIFCLLVRYTGKNLPGRSFDRYTRARNKIYRTFDHDWSNLARWSINNHIHHLSSLFVDISRWRTRNITSSSNCKIFILIFWILLRFECEMSLSRQHSFFELLEITRLLLQLCLHKIRENR